MQIKAKTRIHYFTSSIFSWMSEEGKCPWASDKEKRGPMASTLWRRNLPYRIAGFCTKNHSEQQLTPSWVAEKAQQLSVLLCQEKKGRETDANVVSVVALWFPLQISSAGAQSCWWCQSLHSDPSQSQDIPRRFRGHFYCLTSTAIWTSYSFCCYLYFIQNK